MDYTVINSTIGENVIIWPGSRIVNSVIEDGAVIKTSIIEDSHIGKNVMVGPFAFVRDNSIIGDDSCIGNNSEIARSTIGRHNMMLHQVFIGDAVIGDNNNFGYGVVTANYDGHGKSRTIIGNDNFIGCNCTIIAPRKIGNNTFIGATLKIVKDVEDDQLLVKPQWEKE